MIRWWPCSTKAAISTTASLTPGTRWQQRWAWKTSASCATKKIIENAHNETAPYLQKRLRELNDHPLVGEVRGVGLLGAIELVQDKATRKRYEGKGVGMICRQFCFDNGLIMRAVGDTMIIAPPLVISKAEIDELVTKARKCLDLTLNALQA